MSHRLAFTGPGELCKGLIWCLREMFPLQWVLRHLDQCSKQDFEVTFLAELMLALGGLS